ncbi:hypothetical protein PR001_g32177 [Phytophthora rubi]|uniref:Uncharacterized protein n=2 Tax=Phytophthora rubi TaxID=129364 RepID=A0A6A3GD23_9STRA|nr:hypothetical protein PR001_g32177 [Phytophthora rubi]
MATRVTKLTAQLDQSSQDREAAISKRNEAIREGQKYYDSNRDLLAQIADMQHSYRLVRQDFDRVQDQQDSSDKNVRISSPATPRSLGNETALSTAWRLLLRPPCMAPLLNAVGKRPLPLRTPAHL